MPALTFNVYNFYKIPPNAAKLYEFFYIFSGNKLIGKIVVSVTLPWQRHFDRQVFPNL